MRPASVRSLHGLSLKSRPLGALGLPPLPIGGGHSLALAQDRSRHFTADDFRGNDLETAIWQGKLDGEVSPAFGFPDGNGDFQGFPGVFAAAMGRVAGLDAVEKVVDRVYAAAPAPARRRKETASKRPQAFLAGKVLGPWFLDPQVNLAAVVQDPDGAMRTHDVMRVFGGPVGERSHVTAHVAGIGNNCTAGEVMVRMRFVDIGLAYQGRSSTGHVHRLGRDQVAAVVRQTALGSRLDEQQVAYSAVVE